MTQVEQQSAAFPDPQQPESRSQLFATIDDRVGYVSGRWFGAVGDGATHDYAAIRAAALYAQSTGKALYFPSTTFGTAYMTSGAIPWDGVIYGDSMYSTRITGTDPSKPVIASKPWLTEFGGTPQGRSMIRNLLVKRVASTSGTTVASAASYTRAPGDVVALRMAGNQVSALLNGTEVIAPQTVAEHVAATRHGVGVAGSTGAAVLVSAVSLTAV